jgi:ribonuclease D
MTRPVSTTQPQIDELIAALATEDAVAFDTEFHSERTYIPRLMLMQFATRDRIWLVDPLAPIDLRPLLDAMARPGLTVVGHALKNDLRIAWLQFSKVPTRVFDTQVAAAFLGHGLQAGLGNLLHNTLGVHQPKGDQMADWSQRPLPDRLLGYAAGDVAHLLRLHDLLRDELEALGRLAWVEQECHELCDPTRYSRDPDLAWQRVAGSRRMDPREAGVLQALAAEREILALEEDVVPHFLLPDDVLLLLARHAPRARKDLEGDRRFNHRAVLRHGPRWLEAIGRGLELPQHRPTARPPPGPELEAVAALMMLLVVDIANRNSLAPQLLVKRDTLLEALRLLPETSETFGEAAELQGWRAELLVGPLWSLLNGGLRVTCLRDGPSGFRLAFE